MENESRFANQVQIASLSARVEAKQCGLGHALLGVPRVSVDAIVWLKRVSLWSCPLPLPNMKVFDADVTIDAREHSLIQIFNEKGASGHIVRSLPLGDVQCIYADGTGWLLERKTAWDFEASMRDGRYFEQRSRLLSETSFRAVFVIEGDLRQSTMHAHMLSAMAGIERSDRAQVYRSWDTSETFHLIGVLIGKLEAPPPNAIPPGIAPPEMTTSKRKRDSSPSTAFKRMLMCIPSVSENIAGRLVEEFETLSSLQRALANETPFRQIPLPGGKRLGKARLKHLKQYLLDSST